MITIEVMPDCWRESHKAARNWGIYPYNGAERIKVSEEEAQDIIANDPDGYAHIVEE